MKNFIINLMAKFGFELDTKEDKTPRDFLGETLEENPIRTLTDLIFQSERLNHLILIAEEKAKSMLNMWILKKFTQFRWATREEDFS